MEINNTPLSPSPTVMSKTRWSLVAGLALVVIAAGVWIAMDKPGTGTVLGADTSYQAVFLTNGQVYFGKLSDPKGDWLELSDIYYLQVTQNLQQATGDATKAPTSTGTAATPQSNIQLVKLGSELHGPQDSMHIERDKVLFWENMKDDSKVVQAIHQNQSK